MRRAGIFGLLLVSVFLFACNSEIIRKQEEEIRTQQEEIKRQKQEIEQIRTAKQKEEQKKRDCNLAFGRFEKAQAAKDPRDAVALYRDGLKLCPDDDVAHYELGKILAAVDRREEARQEFEAALKINPNFQAAKQELGKIQRR
jgi:tetratricopeptide (TPR) repeat protein